MKKIVLLIILVFSISAYAANFDFKNLTNNDGLSNSSINTVFQDSNGLMWFGTWDGLNVYNGKEFITYKPIPGDAHSISNNIIRDIIEEKKDYFWIATDLGINRFNSKKQTFERYFVNKLNQNITGEHSYLIAKNSSNQVFAAIYQHGIYSFQTDKNQFIQLKLAQNLLIKKIFFDKDDNLWLYTNDKQVYKMLFKKGKTIPELISIVPFTSIKNIESVFYKPDNELWIQTSNQKIYSYNINTGRIIEQLTDKPIIGNIRTLSFKKEFIYIGTSNGLFSYEINTNSLVTLIPSISVMSLYSGTQDILWVGTDMQGIWQLAPSLEKFHTYSSDNLSGFGKSAVRAFFEDENKMMWIGTKGSGIYTFDRDRTTGKLNLKQHFGVKEGLLSNSVFKIVRGKKNEYWIGTDGRGINYYDSKTKRIFTVSIPDSLQRKANLTSVYALLPDDNNVLWVGTSGYGMYKIEIDSSVNPYKIKRIKQYIFKPNESSLSNNIVFSIIKDDDTHLWIATRGGGLNRFNIDTENFESFRFSNNSDNISSDDVLCIFKDYAGTLWAGTSMGLNKLVINKAKKSSFIRFSEKEGMPNNTVHGILEDKEHNLWLSTNNGIAKFIQYKNHDRIISYFESDGLQNKEFSDGAFFASPTSSLFYFGGINGFNEFDPQKIAQNGFMPKLRLDAFYIDNVKQDISEYIDIKKDKEVLNLSYKHKSVSFRFIPIDYISSSKCEIAYMLEGYQKEWINLGTSNTIVFTNLPKGNYVLKVRCSNADRVWSDEYYILPVKMHPPWWASNVAYLCYAVLIILLLLGINRIVRYQMKVKNDIKMKELEKRNIEDIHQAKLRFFTNIAHEFSNSLTLIYGPCEKLLKAHSSDAFTRKYVQIIKSNSERMQNLIQQLIEFRRAETGHLKLNIEKVDISELVKFVLDHFIDELEQKKIHYSLSLLPESIVWQTDRDSIEKIVFNLISNAVKYTPEDNEIDIIVKTIENKLSIQVRNTGVGIKQEFQENIFDRFEVLNRFEKQVSVGSQSRHGIGLALCKNIVEVLTGDIQVQSDGETFTSFIVHIPVLPINVFENNVKPEVTTGSLSSLPQTKNEQANFGTEIKTETLKGKLILIVEDDQEIRSMLKDILIEKYDVAEASNGKEAIEVVKSHIPLLIVSDIIMPEINGVEFVKIMKTQEFTRHIPIILLSSKTTIESQIEGLEVGADAYLNKPFNPRHLEVLIESLLHKNKTLIDYTNSVYSGLEQYEGKMIRKEDKEILYRITKIINDNIENEELSMDFIANETAISKMQLYRRIKEIIGQTPTEYIRTIRLSHAEKLLKTTNKTVQEIMYMCGFNNKAYFYREFSKKHHQTPKEFRNQK